MSIFQLFLDSIFIADFEINFSGTITHLDKNIPVMIRVDVWQSRMRQQYAKPTSCAV
jgi:hypothetical protein